MSELIKDRQARVEIMKGLVRQLHEGAAEDRVRRQLEALLDEADYHDVFVMEMQLMAEGVPVEAIQRLCDSHTRVLRKQLDLQETPGTVPGHPVHTLIEENRALTETTGKVRLLLEALAAGPADAEAAELAVAVRGGLNALMDVDKHYRRKENLLFPYFEKKNLPGPPAVMWGKHDEARRLLREAMAGLERAGDRAAAVPAVAAALDAIDEMVYKEEKVLIPKALELLSEREWYEIYTQSDEYGYCLVAPEFAWVPEGDLAREVGRPAAVGRVQLPTGSLTADELAALLGALPFDLTFVDRDDVVRYFSPGKGRVFDRSRAILGRQVQFCHPPKSVHVVNQILADFKAGAQDRARFWIDVGGRPVYICYYAVRDGEGAYLGTVEVTQDLTEVRSLEGERRLLAYDDSLPSVP